VTYQSANVVIYFNARIILFQSDYGSPLVASNKQVGIYSWGLECGLPEYPGIYIKMSAVCDWIVINAGL
jgi:trypsin